MCFDFWSGKEQGDYINKPGRKREIKGKQLEKEWVWLVSTPDNLKQWRRKKQVIIKSAKKLVWNQHQK